MQNWGDELPPKCKNCTLEEVAVLRIMHGVDSYLEGCKADGVEPAKPYSGKLNLRMSSELHSRVATFVAATGTTINDFINNAIKNELKKVAAF